MYRHVESCLEGERWTRTADTWDRRLRVGRPRPVERRLPFESCRTIVKGVIQALDCNSADPWRRAYGNRESS